MIFGLLAGTATAIVWAWQLAGCTLTLRPDLKSRVIRGVFHELRPLFLPALVAQYVLFTIDGSDPFSILRLIGFAAGIVNWFLFKDKGGDDDRWKRRRKRLAEKVEQAGSRLTVVPAGGAA